MGTNIEIKARVRDRAAVEARIAALAEGPAERIPQRDTFFPVPSGRLKLRALAPDRGELIFYRREEGRGPRPSRYEILATAEPEAFTAMLAAALGVRGIVAKERLLYRRGQTRIHLDRVEDLGDFVELEVVLRPGQTTAEGEAIARELMAALGIETADLLEAAYIDLLAEGRRGVSG